MIIKSVEINSLIFEGIDVGEIFYSPIKQGYFLRIKNSSNGYKIWNTVNLQENSLETFENSEIVYRCKADLNVEVL